MDLGDIVRKAPNALIWAVSLCFVAILAAFVVLAVTGSNTTDLRSFINTVSNVVGVLLGGSGLVVAGAAAKSASKAEEQTNGDLDKRMQEAVRKELNARTQQGPIG